MASSETAVSPQLGRAAPFRLAALATHPQKGVGR